MCAAAPKLDEFGLVCGGGGCCGGCARRLVDCDDDDDEDDFEGVVAAEVETETDAGDDIDCGWTCKQVLKVEAMAALAATTLALALALAQQLGR